MTSVTKSEQIRLPEQLHILLTDPDSGEPRFDRHMVERALATGIVWELIDCGALQMNGNEATGVTQVAFNESYMRLAALHADKLVPVQGPELVLSIAAQFHPIWEVIAEDMVHEHLLGEEARRRFVFFHKRVFFALSDARRDRTEMAGSLKEAARNLWDPNYEDDLARTHPRLLARIVILDNYRLLKPLIGHAAYKEAAAHLADLRAHIHDTIRTAAVPPPSDYSSSGDSGGCSDSYIYGGGSDFWVDEPAHSHSHDGHDDDGNSDGGDGDGGSGGDGGCGGCGGCGG